MTNEGVSLRERWSSIVAFVIASVGAAIGYGNVWRFPSLVYKYGGGAFFIPYLIAFFIIGIPITILEVSLGQVYQTGDMVSEKNVFSFLIFDLALSRVRLVL